MRILVIEDEHKIADSIKKGLMQESYAVDVAYTGPDGYDLAATEEYDAIVLDWMLPGMDGVQISKELRKENIHTPILFLTAKGEVDNRVMGLNSGADDYLIKPFAFIELLARLKALTRRPKDVIGTELKIGDLRLDSLSYEVTRADKPVRLSRKEFSLLEYLLRHKNRIVTKDQIIQHVWDYDTEILPNTIEVYIGYLRNKIDKNSKQPLIHTVRGFGYKIAEQD